MKDYVSPELLHHQAGVASTLAWCWIVKRLDGVIFSFTSHTSDLLVESVLTPEGSFNRCRAASGFLATDIAKTDTLAQDNFDIQGVLDDDTITEVDIRAGFWKNAKLEICVVNYNDLTMGTNTQFVGSIGNISAGALAFKAEQRGLTQALEANLDGVLSDQCDAQVFDRRCGKNPTPFRRTGIVTAHVNDYGFVDTSRIEADGWWTKGLVTMTSGASMRQVVEVKRSLATGEIVFAEELFFGIAVNDTYSITPGCNKLLLMADGTYTGDCKVKYDNVVRFRGYPRVPGEVKISQYGGQDGST